MERIIVHNMKMIHLVAVGFSAALALGAAAGFGIAAWQNAQLDANPVATSVSTNAPSIQTTSNAQRPTASSGPWNQDLLLFTTDTLGDLGTSSTLIERAGVPSLVQRTDGSLLAAFQWFPSDDALGFDHAAVISSADGGATWTDPEPIVMEGLPDGYQRPFDPTLVVREDGTLFLYFTTSTEPVPGPDQSTMIGVASSTDGVHYTYIGQAFSQDGVSLYDSAVISWNGSWYIGNPRTQEAGQYRGTSTDGLTFTRGTDVSTTGLNWTGNFTNVDGTAYFFGTSSSGTRSTAWYATSSDMETWSDPVSLGVQMGDPAAVRLDDGTWIVIGVSGPVRNESNPSQK